MDHHLTKDKIKQKWYKGVILAKYQVFLSAGILCRYPTVLLLFGSLLWQTLDKPQSGDILRNIPIRYVTLAKNLWIKYSNLRYYSRLVTI